MFRRFMNWLFNIEAKQNEMAVDEYLRAEYRSPPKRGP